ncbi:mRNA-binding protein nab2 [Thecaphora frezii]
MSYTSTPTSTTFRIEVQSTVAKALQDAIQRALAEHAYSPADDPVMAEYIVVMLANQKSPAQITAELRDLVGPEYNDDFTRWIWQQAQQCLDAHAPDQHQQPHAHHRRDPEAGPSSLTPIREEADEPMHQDSSAPQSRAFGTPRSSRSPTLQRRNRSVSPETSARRERADGWERRDGGHQRAVRGWDDVQDQNHHQHRAQAPTNGRASLQRRPRPPSELFSSAMAQAQAGRGGSRLERNRANATRGCQGGGFSTRALAMDDATLQRPPGHTQAYEQRGSGVRIQGVSRRNAASTSSLFGRMSVPDPRAAEFVPAQSAADVDTAPCNASNVAGNGASASLFSRIDPMMPNNQLPPVAATPVAPSAAGAGAGPSYASVPVETALCRWNVGCTNPLCAYSHASPANAGRHGDPLALVLSQEACGFGANCTNRECTRSHVSPAVAFLQRKAAKALRGPGNERQGGKEGEEWCRFQRMCNKAECKFRHVEQGGEERGREQAAEAMGSQEQWERDHAGTA